MATVHVKGLSAETSEKEIRDFFSFCGKISDLKVTPEDSSATTQSAAVTFEKEGAARTALLLDGTQLGKSSVSVTSASTLSDISASSGHDDTQGHDGENLAQEQKPRSRIFAEYLASGYKLGDAALTRAIELDNKHGVSTKFASYLHQLDSKTNATARAQGADQRFGISKGINQAFNSLSTYFDAAKDTDTGRKLHSFYTEQAKSAKDIHTEALRLAGLNAKHNQSAESGTKKHEPEPVAGTDKTHCNCGGEDGVCGCAPGQCSCAGCARKDLGTGDSATGNADAVAASSNLAPLGEKK